MKQNFPVLIHAIGDFLMSNEAIKSVTGLYSRNASIFNQFVIFEKASCCL